MWGLRRVHACAVTSGDYRERQTKANAAAGADVAAGSRREREQVARALWLWAPAGAQRRGAFICSSPGTPVHWQGKGGMKGSGGAAPQMSPAGVQRP